MSDANSTKVPSYGKHKATGQARVVLNGKTVYLGKYGTKASKEAYRRVIQDWLAGGRHLPTGDDLTVNELILAYWRAVGRDLKGGRRHNLKGALQVLKTAYGSSQAPDFGPRALRRVRELMREKDWSRSYVNAQLGWVKRLFRWGCEEELVSGNKPRDLWAVKGVRRGTEGYRESEPVRPVPVADVEATLPHLPPVIGAMVRVQLLAGCRPGEICRLRVPDLDMSKPDLWVYKPPAHKATHLGHERMVYLGPKAIELLRPWLRADVKYLFSPAESEEVRSAKRREDRRTPMTPSHAKRKRKEARARPWGECYTDITYRRAVHRACKKAKVPQWSPNRLRHTRASEIRQRYGLEAAQVVLGHAKADVTQVYAERDRKLGELVATQIG